MIKTSKRCREYFIGHSSFIKNPKMLCKMRLEKGEKKQNIKRSSRHAPNQSLSRRRTRPPPTFFHTSTSVFLLLFSPRLLCLCVRLLARFPHTTPGGIRGSFLSVPPPPLHPNRSTPALPVSHPQPTVNPSSEKGEKTISYPDEQRLRKDD